MRIRLSDDVDGCRGAGDDPVELRPARAADADRDDDVAAERDRGERERADDARGAREGGRREPVDDPRREQREAGRDPGRHEHEVGQHVGVRPLRLASSSIEYANAGHASRNAVSRSTIADAMRTPTE